MKHPYPTFMASFIAELVDRQIWFSNEQKQINNKKHLLKWMQKGEEGNLEEWVEDAFGWEEIKKKFEKAKKEGK